MGHRCLQKPNHIAGLDSEQFSEREQSSRDLGKFGALAEPALRKAYEKKPPPEMRRRLKSLLDALKNGEVSPDQRQAARVTEILEALGTAEARELLRKSAGGSSGPWYAAESKAALRRLDRRVTSPKR